MFLFFISMGRLRPFNTQYPLHHLIPQRSYNDDTPVLFHIVGFRSLFSDKAEHRQSVARTYLPTAYLNHDVLIVFLSAFYEILVIRNKLNYNLILKRLPNINFFVSIFTYGIRKPNPGQSVEYHNKPSQILNLYS